VMGATNSIESLGVFPKAHFCWSRAGATREGLMYCFEHSMQEVVEMSVANTISQEDNHGKLDVSINGAANDCAVGPSAREILLGRNAENSTKGQEMISVGMPSTAEDISTKNKGLFIKTSNVSISDFLMLLVGSGKWLSQLLCNSDCFDLLLVPVFRNLFLPLLTLASCRKIKILVWKILETLQRLLPWL